MMSSEFSVSISIQIELHSKNSALQTSK